jgi:GT2 family glycosyltransferase
VNAPAKGVSIVIPTYNGKALLERFLPSVLASAEFYQTAAAAPVEVIVVDDGSRDDTPQWLRATFPDRVRCLAQSENRGFGPTCNVGFRAAEHPIIWLLNNDIRTAPDALPPLVESLADPNVFAVGCRALRIDGEAIDGMGRVGEIVRGYLKVFKNYGLLPEYDRAAHGPLHTMMASGGYAAFDAAKLHELGGFEELLSPFYWEDAEICYRAWKRGWSVVYEPQSLVFHQSSATIGERFPAASVSVIATRNRMLLHWINLHDRRMWTAHALMTALLLIGDLMTGRLHHWRAFGGAWRKRREAFARRRIERAAATRTDREVLRIIAETLARPGVMTFKNDAEEQEYRRRCRAAAPPLADS